MQEARDVMRLDLECWIDGQPERRGLQHLDRWQVQAAHKFTLVGAGEAASLTFHQQPQALSGRKLGVAAVAWDGAFVLAAYLAAQGGSRWAGARAVELGAGVGVLGVLLAAWGACVVLTDRDVVLPLLRQNVAANAEALGGRASVESLEWGTAGSLARADELAAQGLDFVVAADCLYIDQDGQTPSLDAFLRTCHALAAEPRCVVLLAFEARSAELRTAFLAQAAAMFAKVEPASQECLPSGFQAGHVELYTLSSRRLVLAADGLT